MVARKPLGHQAGVTRSCGCYTRRVTVPRTGLDDTRASAAEVQIELMRRAGPVRCAALALKLTTGSVRRSRQAIRARAPHADDAEIGLRFVELHYGRDLAQRVRAYLERGTAWQTSSSTR